MQNLYKHSCCIPIFLICSTSVAPSHAACRIPCKYTLKSNLGGVSLHWASSPNEFSWHVIFVDRISTLILWPLRAKNWVTSPMQSRRLIYQPIKSFKNLCQLTWIWTCKLFSNPFPKVCFNIKMILMAGDLWCHSAHVMSLCNVLI